MRLLAAIALLALLPGCLVFVPLPGPTIETGGRVVEPVVTRAATVPLGAMGATMNGIRADAGLPALRASALLTQIAQSHADDLARTGAVSHVGSDGRDLGARLRHFGCSHRGAAENLAWGMGSADQAVTGWAARPEHRRNMLGPYTRYGSGSAQGYYVAVFANGC